jgi:hypothetical protein
LHQSPSISHKHTLRCHTLYIFDKMQVIHVSWKKCEASKQNFLWHVMQLRLKDKDVESIKKKRMLLRFTYLQNLLFVVGKSMNIYHNSFIWVFRVYLKTNKFFNNFHLSESSFICPELRASGLAWRLKYMYMYIVNIIFLWYNYI